MVFVEPQYSVILLNNRIKGGIIFYSSPGRKPVKQCLRGLSHQFAAAGIRIWYGQIIAHNWTL